MDLILFKGTEVVDLKTCLESLGTLPVMLFGLGLLAGLVFVFDLLIDGVVFDLLSCHISR
jgi:hypothetical protein